jgi:hypothetical protein
VLDIKFRMPGLHRTIPRNSRIMSIVHGLNYLQPIVLFSMAVLLMAVSLWSGKVPTPLARPDLAHVLPLIAVLTCYEVFRRKFYLDPANEGGIHWRARLMRIAKCPCLLLALIDVIRGRRFQYALTPKAGREQRSFVLGPMHAPATAFVAVVWGAAALTERIQDPLLHIFAGMNVLLPSVLVATEFLPRSPRFSRELAERQSDGAASKQAAQGR